MKEKTDQADGTDPVTGRRALLSEMSCSLRVLAGVERAKLREKIDSRDPGLLEDNSVYEQRGALGLGADDTHAGDTAEIVSRTQAIRAIIGYTTRRYIQYISALLTALMYC